MFDDKWPATEEWRAIDGYDGWYEVSSHGRVRSWKKAGGEKSGRREEPKLFKPQSTGYGLRRVLLGTKGNQHQRMVHRLVAAAFIHAIPPGMVVCHNDGNPVNNHVSNLRIDTQSSNERDKEAHGTSIHGVRNPNARLTPADVIEIRKLRSEGLPVVQIAERFDVSYYTIYDIGTGRTWKQVA